MPISGKAGPRSLNDVREQIDDLGRNNDIGTDHFARECRAKFGIPYLQCSETRLVCSREVTGRHLLADLWSRIGCRRGERNKFFFFLPQENPIFWGQHVPTHEPHAE